MPKITFLLHFYATIFQVLKVSGVQGPPGPALPTPLQMKSLREENSYFLRAYITLLTRPLPHESNSKLLSGPQNIHGEYAKVCDLCYTFHECVGGSLNE